MTAVWVQWNSCEKTARLPRKRGVTALWVIWTALAIRINFPRNSNTNSVCSVSGCVSLTYPICLNVCTRFLLVFCRSMKKCIFFFFFSLLICRSSKIMSRNGFVKEARLIIRPFPTLTSYVHMIYAVRIIFLWISSGGAWFPPTVHSTYSGWCRCFKLIHLFIYLL